MPGIGVPLTRRGEFPLVLPSRTAGKAVTAPPLVPPAPVTPVRDVVEVLHGTEVHDPYRWLEDRESEETAWSAAQNMRTRQVLDALPWRRPLHDRLLSLLQVGTISSDGPLSGLAPAAVGPAVAGDRVFFLERERDQDQTVLVVRSAVDAETPAKVVVEGRTSRERLAIRGASNGGLLVGAAITQRPDLCRAAICAVPLIDMLRFHHFLLGAVWVTEYGNPDVLEQFAAIAAYSPYHHVVEGTPYPATLITTAESDSMVDPLHARKFAARLQAATAEPDERPVLVRIEARAGHGPGKPAWKQADEAADIWAFVFWQLGMALPGGQPGSGRSG